MDLLTMAQLLGNFGEFVGAIAVVVTLAYLAVQVKQSSTSALANAYQSWVSANVGINVAMSNAHQSEMILVGNMDPTKLRNL